MLSSIPTSLTVLRKAPRARCRAPRDRPPQHGPLGALAFSMEARALCLPCGSRNRPAWCRTPQFLLPRSCGTTSGFFVHVTSTGTTRSQLRAEVSYKHEPGREGRACAGRGRGGTLSRPVGSGRASRRRGRRSPQLSTSPPKGRIRAATQLHRRVRIGNDRFGDWGVIDLRPSPVSPSFLSRGVGSVTHALGAHRIDDGYHDPYRSLNRN